MKKHLQNIVIGAAGCIWLAVVVNLVLAGGPRGVGVGQGGVVAGAAEGAAEAERVMVFMGVNVVDVEKGEIVRDRAVVVSGSKIMAVAAADGFKAPAGAVVAASEGKFLIPGLWDMHVHHEMPWPPLLDLALVNGVTGVRDLNSEPFVLTWRDEIRAGKRLGPRIVASGKYLDAKVNGGPPGRVTVDTPEIGRRIVRERKQAGVDFIKVYSGLSPEVYRAVIEEAKAQGLAVAGHCPERVSALEASRLGQRSLEHLGGIALSISSEEAGLRRRLEGAFGGPHGYDFDPIHPITEEARRTVAAEKQAALFAAFKANGTWQTPTLVTLRPLAEKGSADPRLKYMHAGFTQLWELIQANDRYGKVRQAQYAHGRALVRAMHQAGVGLLAGTDAGGSINVRVFPGFSLADELELLVECGLTSAEALRTATLNPARYLGEEASAGTIAAGKRADLVLLEADPLIAIGNVRKIAGVMTGGRWLGRPELDKMLERAAGSVKLR